MKRHLVIAGTGRAGTSFLVQYLTACGLETHITRNPHQSLDENANAGLEDVPTEDGDLPYVIKSPWLYEFIDRLLERPDIVIDGVILPMRDIVEAASSRVTLEIQGRLSQGVGEEHSRWESWGVTPGGVVYSLDPLDQARLLAMGFHHVVQRLVQKDIPIVLLDFPRFATDGEYLYGKLQSIIETIVDHNTAIEAHKITAKPELIRVGNELLNKASKSTEKTFERKYPTYESLDRSALFRELEKCRSALQDSELRARDFEQQISTLHLRIEEANTTIEQQRVRLEGELASARTENTKLMAAATESQAEISRYRDAFTEISNSTIWRATKPFRFLLSNIRANLKRKPQ